MSSEKNNESSKISSTQETFTALEQENDEVELEIVIVATTEEEKEKVTKLDRRPKS